MIFDLSSGLSIWFFCTRDYEITHTLGLAHTANMEFVTQEKIVHHTVFLEYFNITEEELSNFAFQSF